MLLLRNSASKYELGQLAGACRRLTPQVVDGSLLAYLGFGVGAHMTGNRSSRAIWISLASVLISASAGSGALAQSYSIKETVVRLNKSVALAKAAIAQCDYDKYVEQQGKYDFFLTNFGVHNPNGIQPFPFPPYPFPCLPRSRFSDIPHVAGPPYRGGDTLFVADRGSLYTSLLGGGTAGRTPFDVTPPFSAPGNSGFLEVDMGFRTQVSGTPWMYGARFGVIGGPLGNAEFYPASGFDYSARQRITGIGEFSGSWTNLVESGNRDGSNQTFGIINRLTVEGSLGVALGSREVVARMPGFDFKDTTTDLGVTSAIRIEVPFSDYLSGLAQVRYLHMLPGTVNIPGPVNVTSDIWYFGAGISINLTPLLRRRDDRYPVM
jgi:hypothetical protein